MTLTQTYVKYKAGKCNFPTGPAQRFKNEGGGHEEPTSSPFFTNRGRRKEITSRIIYQAKVNLLCLPLAATLDDAILGQKSIN